MSERAVRSRSFTLSWPAERALGLFTPEGERAWAEGWNPEYIHPRDGRTEAGMVFVTRHGGDTVWTMTRYDTAAGIVEYVRTTPGSRTAIVLVQCAPLAPGRTRVTVQYAMTGLSEAGDRYVRDEMSEASYGEMIEDWRAALAKLGATS